jgi:cysteinyl-tRNA synthetase
MPIALALLREILRAPLNEDERRWLILDADAVLGFDLDRVWETPATEAAADGDVPLEIAALVATRQEARSARDWARADALRAELDGLGWIVIDGPDGSTVRRTGPA